MTRSPAVRSTALAALSCGAAALGLPGARAADQPRARFAVAAENEASARAAMQVLESGGSAADAAIAASLMLGVTAPVSCGIGGGGFALVFDAAEKKSFVLDYREMAPARYDLALL